MKNFFSNLTDFYQEFFQKSPCLFLALSILIGALAALYDYPVTVVFLFFLWVPYVQENTIKEFFLYKKTALFRVFLSLLLCVMSFFYTKASLFTLPEKPQYITGTFLPLSITPKYSFSKKILYQGTLTVTNGNQKKKFPCRFYNKPKESRLKGNYLYEVKGVVFPLKNGLFLQATQKKPLKKISTLVELRFQAKKWVGGYLEKTFSSSILQNLFKALLIAENDDVLLRFSFSKVGLQHLMAISGLHFGIVMMFLSFFLSKIFPFRVKTVILWAFLLIYFLFLGTSPSIQRAWVMAQVILWAQLLEKRTFSLNALGIALFVAILYNPLDIKNLGLQLSFLASFSLIVLYPFFERFFSLVIPMRSKEEISSLFAFSKITYYFLSFIRGCLAIACSIHLTTLPLIFFYFQKFPLLSLFYNLFYPYLIAIIICVFLFCFIVDLFLPLIGGFLHGLCEKIFLFFLDPIFYIPSCLDVSVFLSFSSFELVMYYLIFFFALIFLNKKAFNERWSFF